MKSDWTLRWKTAAAQFALGGVGLALITFVCFRLGLGITSAAFACVVVIAGSSLLGSFSASVVLSVAAAGCLNFFFAPPLFEFRIDSPDDLVAIAGFVTTSLIVTALTTKVRRAGEAARTREEHWREVFEHNPIMYFMIDPAGTVLSVNATGAAQLGYEVDELVGHSVFKVFFEEDREFVQRNVAVCLQTPGRSNGWEVRKLRKDGTVIWVREIAKAVRRPGDQIMVLVACDDVTDRRRVEQALRKSETYLAEAQKLSQTGSWAFSPVTGKTVYWSEEMFRIWGFDPRQGPPVPEAAWQRIHPEDLGRMRSLMENARRGQIKSDVVQHHRIVLPDGTVKHIQGIAHPVFDERGEVVEYVGTAVDVTERIRAEEELRASEARFRTFVDFAADTFMLHGEDGTILDVNRHACESLGYTREELIGRHPTYFDLDLEARLLVIRDRLDAGEIFTFESRNRRNDGTVFPVEVRVRSFRDRDRRLSVSLARDITERRRAEAELQEALAELARVSRVTTLGELTAAIAHEVTQPLTGLLSSGNACIRWLADDALNLEAARRAVERMIRDGSRATEVISRIRALVRKSPAKKDWLNINEVVGEVLSLVRTEVQRNNITLQTKLADDIPLIFGDRIQLQQVILNLIMNAKEAMSAAVGGPRELSISSTKSASNDVLVTVSDSGPGFDGAKLENIFDAFYTTKSEGMGIGLAVSQSIIRAHGGNLSAAPNQPRGAVFRFTLSAGGVEPG